MEILIKNCITPDRLEKCLAEPAWSRRVADVVHRPKIITSEAQSMKCAYCQKEVSYIPSSETPFCKFCGAKIYQDENNYDICFQIISLLDFKPIGLARYILREADTLLQDCHLVNTQNSRFKAKKEEFLKFASSSD